MRESRRLAILWAFTACYRDSFTFFFFFFLPFMTTGLHINDPESWIRLRKFSWLYARYRHAWFRGDMI
jgi:hypothetical protein